MKLIRNAHLSCVLLVVASLCPALPVYAGFQSRTPLKWDAFSQIPCAEEVARVDNYGNELRKQSGALAVVIVYAGHHDTRRGEVVARLFGIRDRLKNANSIDLNRIMILAGGFREKLEVQLWILPAEIRDTIMTLLDLGAASKDTRLKLPELRKWEYKCRGGPATPRAVQSATTPADLTGASDSELQQHLGERITMHGRFSLQGKLAPFILVGGRPIYLVRTESFSWGEPYASMEGRNVRVTGTLRFAHYPEPPPEALPEGRPYDHFYFEAKTAKVELSER